MSGHLQDLEFDTLQVSQVGRVVTALVDDPPYNFMTARMQRDLDQLSAAVERDESVGAVILSGAAPERYITHFDIGDILAAAERAGRPLSEGRLRRGMKGIEMAGAIPGAEALLEGTPVGGILNVTRFNEVVLRIMRSPAVWIAAVNGPCGGGGCEMSVCFDVRIAADEGAGFVLPELLIGLTTTVGAQRLVQLIGPGRALELMLEGRMYSPEEALEMGLIGRVVARAQLLDEARELAELYSRRPRVAVAAQKKIFNEFSILPPAESLRREGAANVATITSGPALTALSRWVEMQKEGGGESVFLTDLETWIDGRAVDMNETSTGTDSEGANE